MEVRIEKLDNQGRGICFVDGKITFVKNALPYEVVDIKIDKVSKKYNEAQVVKFIKKSCARVESPCAYFTSCGGCRLLHSNYDDTIKYKKEKLTEILSRHAGIKTDIDIVRSPKVLGYRNKITLKVVDGAYGYYETASHNLVKIDTCLLASEAIQKFLPDIEYLGIKNGELVVRSNYNNELLIWIKSDDEVDLNLPYLMDKHKITGIVFNDKVIVGESYFIEIVNKQFFTVSYDSFFQINREICSCLFDLVNENIKAGETILDLYCGVGTLGIHASLKAKKVYGIEIVPNAVLSAIKNAKINKRDSIYYMLGDVGACLPKIKDCVDTIIVDPPRAGLDKVTKETIVRFSPKKIIYVSCDPMTLARDLKELKEYYNVEMVKGLDMFPFTHHIESFCVLNRR